MFGSLVLWNAVLALWALTSPSSSPVNTLDATHAPSAPPVVVPTSAPTNAVTPNKTVVLPVLKKLVGQAKLPPAPPAKPLPSTISCPVGRKVRPGDTVYMTLDDGPSIGSRKYLLQALGHISEKITFYESAYNICPQTSSLVLDCDDAAKLPAIELMAWTIKQGHMLAAHSDSHLYDRSTGYCDYVKMGESTNVPPQYASCGRDATADIVRGALRFQETMALADDALWESADEKAAYAKQIANMWTYARLPCSNVWRMAGDYKFDMGWGSQTSETEKASRISVADAIATGTNKCKPETYMGKPWYTTGWDVEWAWKELKDTAAEKCRMIQVIEHEFSRAGRDPRRNQAVVVLGHDYHYNTPEKAAMFRDLLVELKLRGYVMDTIDHIQL